MRADEVRNSGSRDGKTEFTSGKREEGRGKDDLMLSVIQGEYVLLGICVMFH